MEGQPLLSGTLLPRSTFRRVLLGMFLGWNLLLFILVVVALSKENSTTVCSLSFLLFSPLVYSFLHFPLPLPFAPLFLGWNLLGAFPAGSHFHACSTLPSFLRSTKSILSSFLWVFCSQSDEMGSTSATKQNAKYYTPKVLQYFTEERGREGKKEEGRGKKEGRGRKGEGDEEMRSRITDLKSKLSSLSLSPPSTLFGPSFLLRPHFIMSRFTIMFNHHPVFLQNSQLPKEAKQAMWFQLIFMEI